VQNRSPAFRGATMRSHLQGGCVPSGKRGEQSGGKGEDSRQAVNDGRQPLGCLTATAWMRSSILPLCFLSLRALLCLCPQKRRGAWASPCCRSLERYTQFDNWRSSCNQKPKPGSGLHTVAAGSSGVKLRFLIQRNSLDQEPEGVQAHRPTPGRTDNKGQAGERSEQQSGSSFQRTGQWRIKCRRQRVEVRSLIDLYTLTFDG